MKIVGIPFLQGAAGRSSTVSKTGIAIHATANPGASAEAEAQYAANRDDGIGAHAFYDNDSGVMSCDTVQRVGHAGSNNGNLNAVAVEITGANQWTRQQWIDRVAWPLLGDGLAQVCRAHGIPAVWLTVEQMKANPRTKGFYTHDDMRRAWGGTDHTDPGPNFPKDVLMSAVQNALNGGNDMAALEPTDPSYIDLIYRVAALISNTNVAGPRPGEVNKLAAALAAIAGQASSNGSGITQILAKLDEPVPVDLTDAQLDLLADKVAERLGALRFVATDPA